MKAKTNQRSFAGRGLKGANASTTGRVHLPRRTIAVAFVALGLIAVSAAMPAASAAKAAWHDDNKDGTCPANFPYLFDWNSGYPEEYDKNGNGQVCHRYVG